ncbi:MAG: hypothetical protein ACTSU5_19530 [Promethearchaeota archaeon]
MKVDKMKDLAKDPRFSLGFGLAFEAFVFLSLGIQLVAFPAFAGVVRVNSWGLIPLFLGMGVAFAVLSTHAGDRLAVKLAVPALVVSILLGVAMLAFFLGPFNWLLCLMVFAGIGVSALGLLGAVRLLKAPASRGVLVASSWRGPLTLKKLLLLALLGGWVATAVGTTLNWGYSVTVQAPAGFNTISSYWGPPADERVTVTREVTPADLTTIHLSNDTANASVDNMGVGSFCYAKSVTTPGGTHDYCNYSAGAESYPNGTIFLSEPLPSLASVLVTFVYRHDISVFETLGETNATLIINYLNEGDDFIYHTNVFERVERTYLLQLFDWWGVKYYLDVGISSLSFPQVFNYPAFVKVANQTVWWASRATYGTGASRACQRMVGISADFEGSDAANPQYNPLKNYAAQPIPGLVPYDDWVDYNEQNATLYGEAVQAWEDVYSYCSENGFKFYAVFQEGAMNDVMDGDLDYTRLPVYPVSRNPDVLYGIMNYQDNRFDGGRYLLYENCKTQLALLGDQGNTVLTGWIQKGTKYYTDDEVGFQRYVRDCLIAQAAGMVEIFHAPLYRMQGKWGSGAIQRLHDALHNATKEKFVLRAPAINDFDTGLMVDYLKNWNRPLVAVFFWPGALSFAFVVPYPFGRNSGRARGERVSRGE